MKTEDVPRIVERLKRAAERFGLGWFVPIGAIFDRRVPELSDLDDDPAPDPQADDDNA